MMDLLNGVIYVAGVVFLVLLAVGLAGFMCERVSELFRHSEQIDDLKREVKWLFECRDEHARDIMELKQKIENHRQ